MSDAALKALASVAGLQVAWTDADGRQHDVGAETLRSVLAALGYPADNGRDIEESRQRLTCVVDEIPPLITAHRGQPVALGRTSRGGRLHISDHGWRDLEPANGVPGYACIRAPDAIGYHKLELENSTHILAVAPPCCYSIENAAPGRKLAGLATQIYSLPGGHSEGFGDFAALGEFSQKAGRLGIDAIAVSPTHARFASRPESISPYSPSSRFFLDPIYADLGVAEASSLQNSESRSLIDWLEVHQRKYARLKETYEAVRTNGAKRTEFDEFCKSGGPRLRDHAVYEALAAHFREEGKRVPRAWPLEYRRAGTPEVRAFAERENEMVEYFLFLQWITCHSAAAAQARAKGGMCIGLIADMAVGVDPTGSHAWSVPDEVMGTLSLGAPPDTFNPAGQGWGLTTFSPAALRRSGYDGFITMVRAAMQHAGGIRIDHVMGLQRLWVLPAGAAPTEGVYLNYPLQDLIRLIELESVRHSAIVIGEDLGTVPEGFRAQLSAAGILGMRVLWFERDSGRRFIRPGQWDKEAVALTTTHDLPTVAGWWRGRDLDWSEALDRKTQLGSIAAERREREEDRHRLWSSFQDAGCTGAPEPETSDSDPVIRGALGYVGKTSCVLAIAAAEDITGTPEQPNLPGTIDEHPNWRRRLPADLLENSAAQDRVNRLVSARNA